MTIHFNYPQELANIWLTPKLKLRMVKWRKLPLFSITPGMRKPADFPSLVGITTMQSLLDMVDSIIFTCWGFKTLQIDNFLNRKFEYQFIITVLLHLISNSCMVVVWVSVPYDISNKFSPAEKNSSTDKWWDLSSEILFIIILQ